ncbi:MAG TPA: LLM class F420-dependent oxidoreductase, partial [Actinomycetes bacterium]|nr:LLM class F420-dependent oxidoreductase [Actinomycetes bacterium]
AAANGRSATELRRDQLGGTVEEVVDKIGRFGEVGASRIYLQVLDLHDLDQLRLAAAEVMPRL